MENGVKMVLFAFLKKDLPAHLVAVRVRPERQKEVFYSYKKKKKKKKIAADKFEKRSISCLDQFLSNLKSRLYRTRFNADFN